MASRGGGKKWLMQVVALYDHQPEEADELEFFEGDVLRVLQIQDDGWWYGFRLDDPEQVGLFPSNYVKKQTMGNPYDERHGSTPPPKRHQDQEDHGFEQDQRRDRAQMDGEEEGEQEEDEDEDHHQQQQRRKQWKNKPQQQFQATRDYAGAAGAASGSQRSLLKQLQQNLVKAEQEKQLVQEARQRVQSDLERRRVVPHGDPHSEEEEDEEEQQQQEQEQEEEQYMKRKNSFHSQYDDQEPDGRENAVSGQHIPIKYDRQRELHHQHQREDNEEEIDEDQRDSFAPADQAQEQEQDSFEDNERRRLALETTRIQTAAASRISHCYRSYHDRRRVREAQDRERTDRAQAAQRQRNAGKKIYRALHVNAQKQRRIRQESKQRAEEAKAAQEIQIWFQQVRVRHQEHQVALETAAVVCIQRWARQMIRYARWKRRVEQERRKPPPEQEPTIKRDSQGKRIPSAALEKEEDEEAKDRADAQLQRIINASSLLQTQDDTELKNVIRQIVKSQLEQKLAAQDVKVKELQSLVGKLQQVIQKQSEMIQESSEYIMEMEIRRRPHHQRHSPKAQHNQQHYYQQQEEESLRSQMHPPRYAAPSRIPQLNAKAGENHRLYHPVRPDESNSTKLPVLVHSQSHRRVGPTSSSTMMGASLKR